MRALLVLAALLALAGSIWFSSKARPHVPMGPVNHGGTLKPIETVKFRISDDVEMTLGRSESDPATHFMVRAAGATSSMGLEWCIADEDRDRPVEFEWVGNTQTLWFARGDRLTRLAFNDIGAQWAAEEESCAPRVNRHMDLSEAPERLLTLLGAKRAELPVP